ncbi:MAG: gliding motility-associated C-terminal domain-containing protein [Bacteroidota bacterium]
MKSILHHFASVTGLLLTFGGLYAQSNMTSSWSKKLEYQKAFIENKGQFTIPNSLGNPAEVLYAVDHGGTKIYFTKKGVTYSLLEATKKQKDQREIERERREEFKNPEEHARHEKEEHELKTKTDQVTMLWQNANPDVQIEASYITSDYHNYYFKQADGQYKDVSHIKGYKKITYKNLYPNIDVEYMFSEKDGLKYSLTLHPGADPSLVKMVYDHHVSLNNAGEIRISTKFGDIIDHAPLTFYQQNHASVITSSFSKSGKTISFQLSNYDNTKTVVIDPWTQTPAFASNWDCVWECEIDGAGNTYIIGGVTPMQLLKYNAAGALQWTYNTPYDTTSWLGTFAVDNAGNSYVTLGSTAKIVKVSTAGAVVWNNNNPGGLSLLTEFWCITFNCDQTRLIIGGTGGSGLTPTPYIYELNMANGNSVANYQVAGAQSFFGSEIRAIAPSGNGRYYYLTHDTLGAITQNFTSCSSPIAFKINNTYSLSYKSENFRYNNTGICAIKANTSFVYTHRGNRLDKRSLATGAILASVAIPGGGFASGQVQASGIDLDNCGNIYVGSKNAVYKFDVNLVQQASYVTTFNVYDVHVTSGGNIIACGSTGTSATGSRTGTIEHINAGACTTISLTCCDANICQSPNFCTTSPAVNLQASTAGGTWSGTGITNTTTGTFNPATAGVGSHVITYSLACGVGTTTILVSSCSTVSLCISSGSLTVIGGASTYTWASTTTSVNCSGCPFGVCSPFCPGVTVPTWTASGTTVAAPSATVFPIKVKDLGSGITYTFTTLASIPPCTTTACPTLTMAVTSQTNVNCFGANTGSATVSTSGGTGPYTYTWSPGSLTGASQTGLGAGTYTIAIKDANACTGTGTVIITQPTASLSAVISATTTTGCGTSTGGATVTASGGTTGYTYSWNPGGATTAGVSNLAAGNHTVTVTDSKGCTRIAIANITTAVGPTLSVVSQSSVNCFGASTGTATVSGTGGTGPYSFTWTPGNLTGVSQTSLSAGTYTINVSDANSCAGSGTLSISQPTSALNAVITATTAAGCGSGTSTVTFWTETFGTGCSQGSLASAYTGTNGAWAVTATGANSAEANQFFVSATENGNAAGACGSACGSDRSLHVGNVAAPILGLTADQGAAYNAGGFCGTFFCTATDRRAESPTINCTGQSNITLNFNYMEFGDGTNDDGSLYYFDGTSWNLLLNLSKTTCCGGATCNGSLQGLWTAFSATLPASANNNPNIKIGYRWVNNDDGIGTDPSFAIDDISLSSVSGSGGLGGATVTATGGTPSYNYTWTPGGGTTAGVSNLAAGTHTVIVTDVNGCTTSAVANITSTSGPTLSVASQTNVNCFGANTGTATISSTGGTGPYTYTWSPGNLSGVSQSSLSAGTYTINVQDANQCVGTTTLSITQPTAAVSAVISATTSAACGSSTGGATVTASGGTPSYTYSWSPGGAATAGVSNLASGSHTVLVTDSKGCTTTVIANISSTSGPTLAVVSQTNVNCFGANTGSATVNASGGTGPYSYTWSPGNLTGASQTGLSAGTYTINVSDANLCAGTGTLLITQPTASLTGVISNTTAPGCGLSNGSASVTASGGTASYTYSWNPNGGSASSASNLSSGANTVTITDSKGCTSAITVFLNSAGGPTVSVASQANVNCFGASTGSASISLSGGTGPFSYTWSPSGGNAASASGLTAGVYTISVSDANSCSGSTTVSITQPTAALSVTITNSPTGCGTAVGSATATSAGGTPSYNYTWSAPIIAIGNIANNLAAGTYSVLVTDANGCQETATTTIMSAGGGPTLSIASQTNVLCNATATGAASISPSGATGPYSYTWSPSGGNASSATGLSAGVYTVTVNDASSCTSTISITISSPAAITTSLTATDASCINNDGSATINASGGTATLAVLWQTGSANNTITGLSPGSYSVVITDANNCTSTATAVVGASGGLTVDAGIGSTIMAGDTALLISPSISGATVIWSPSQSVTCYTCSTTGAFPLVTTTYTITATLGSCSASDVVTIVVDIDEDLIVPNVFTPNGDGSNDVFTLKATNIGEINMTIFDRWGLKMFGGTATGNITWDGKTLSGSLVPDGTYFYIIKAVSLSGKEYDLKGSVNLFR